jgi:hypothetical protein
MHRHAKGYARNHAKDADAVRLWTGAVPVRNVFVTTVDKFT